MKKCFQSFHSTILIIVLLSVIGVGCTNPTNDSDDATQSTNGDAYEPDDTQSAASTYTIGTDGMQARSFHDSGDEDWVAVSIATNSWFSVETDSDGTDIDTELYLYDPDGDFIAYNDDASSVDVYSNMVYEADKTGTYYVRIKELDSLTGNYKFQISSGGSNQLSPDSFEPDNRNEDANDFTVGDAVETHTFHRLGDIDWFAISLTADNTYTIRTTAPGSGSRADTALLLFTESDQYNPIESTDDYEENTHGMDETISFTPSSTGTYYALVVRVGGAGDSYGFQVTG